MIILAGHEEQMETFLGPIPGLAAQFTTRIKFASYTPAGDPAAMRRLLSSNPGLASMFGTPIQFPSYSASELSSIAMLLAEREGDALDPAAAGILDVIFRHACQAGRIGQLGNGWFARALLKRARVHRDVRVAQIGDAATVNDLTTVTAADLSAAYQDLADLRATDLPDQ